MSLRLRPDISACDTQNTLILLDQRRGRYWQLNTTGAAVLRALLSGATPTQIATRLSTARPVTLQRATADINALIEHLIHARLADPVPTP
jgi:Coenzyme PQQ synthesis protein D (PqqD)